MAVCIPSPERATPNSSAEAKLFEALSEQLDDDYLVLHSVAWIARPGGGGARDGECDFIVCHPHRGILVLEVKGGRIDLDYGSRTWTSTDKSGRVHAIKNPFEQAARGKHALIEKLADIPAWRKLGLGRVTIGHAAFFPDIGDGARLAGPDAPGDIIGDSGHLEGVAAWVARALEFWATPSGPRGIGRSGLDVVRQTFARVSSTRPLLSARLAEEERLRLVLTERQAGILDFLSRQRRVMISGGAGTGKTLIAREKAIRSASEGMRTLLACYNRGLADHLREQCAGIADLDVATFHQVCHRWIERGRIELGRDLVREAAAAHPGRDGFDHHQPLALALAVDALGPAYDAIIVDEAQDFGDEFWLPIEMLLTDLDQGLLYVFLDENQDLYRRSASIPIKGEPMVLDRNCRNTGRIHTAAYRYYRGLAVQAPEIAGTEIAAVAADGLARQAQAIRALITRLVVDEKVAPHDIAVLLCDAGARAACEQALASGPLPKPARFERLERYGPGVVTVDSVARFKGLERGVVILWALDACLPSSDREVLYVGMSRAKAILYLCGSVSSCKRLLEMAAG